MLRGGEKSRELLGFFEVFDDKLTRSPAWPCACLNLKPPLTSMLIVDPDVPVAAALARIVEPGASSRHGGMDVTLCSDFFTARSRLRAAPPALLITALRLREYNGLNLVY